MLVVLVGCSRREPQQTKTRFEAAKLDLLIQNDTTIQLGWTNNCLVYQTKTNPVATDIYSLQQATEILGQYGWQFVSSESDGTHEYYHLQRQVQSDKSDGHDPIILGVSAASLISHEITFYAA
ncbi:MAG TPA: hypothetical protein VHX90_01045 [Verrucomicrobiae bacterium]|nr:hypothetical protein [Verrucomicrobiae bacterium]